MANKNAKEIIVAIPVIGYLARIVSNVIGLPRLHSEIFEELNKTTDLMAALRQQAEQDTAATGRQANALNDKLARIEQAQDSIQQQISQLAAGPKQKGPVAPKGKDLFADDHLMDKFYGELEDKFRGTEQMIMERQEEYLPYFVDSKIDFKKTPVLDIGSGRGEFIGLLKTNGVKAVGLDINLEMVERSKKKGLDAVQGDALNFLQDKSAQSFGAITGFHIVEHIPFSVLLRIFRNAHRTLAKDGFVIFETPNPENLIVGSHNFYMDPSHLHPLPPILLAFALETSGFRNVEIKRLHPDEEHKQGSLPKDVFERLYGPRDYAVIGYK